MIVYPKEWETVGQPISPEQIEQTLLEILSDIDCKCLAFSGGLDSSLMLYFLTQIHSDGIRLFTTGLSDEHPDVRYSRLVAAHFGIFEHHVYIPTSDEVKAEQRPGDFPGDVAVRLFYRFVSECTYSIISCDGIDEFMAGYYPHMNEPIEVVYYDFLRRLRDEHLRALNRNSGIVKVYLPCIDKRLILLMAQIPLSEKVDHANRKKTLMRIARDRLPTEVIERHKYGFCDALRIKPSKAMVR